MTGKQKRDRYEMHKYWGKKPAKDLKQLIERYTKEGDTILDPFSGYGVFCCEAFLLNRNVISNDLNPISNFINRLLLEKNIDLKKLEDDWSRIKTKFAPFVNEWFDFKFQNRQVYLINILRNKQNQPLKCRFRLPDNTKIYETEFTHNEIQNYLEYENSRSIDDWYPVTELIENSRISAKPGMKISDLFTKRTLACHARLLSLIESISTGNEKDLLKLAFTANLANCSKLVPPIKTRGDMAAGAWMTGFYIGETYIENNVLEYFENRIQKVIKGKKDYLNQFTSKTNASGSLFEQVHNSSYQVTTYDAKNLIIPNESVDYIFTDPPYGDAVPYFEQSIIWNSWLKLTPDYKNEIVVTDSKLRKKDIRMFEADIEVAFSEIRRVLKMGGTFSLTYHSLSGLEWKAITNACIKNGFELIEFEWLVQKAFTPRQLNRAKSIKGDVLITLEKVPSIQSTILSTEEIINLLLAQLETWLSEKPLDTNEIFLKIMKFIFSKKIIMEDIDLFDILTANFRFSDTQKWILNDKLELC